jgi:hypothetical protein
MFILENKTDGSVFGAKSFYIKSEFSTAAAAKAALTRYTKKYADHDYIKFDPENFKVTAWADYDEPQITRTKRFPGTGEERTYTIGINSIGTCTDPATETYWSM